MARNTTLDPPAPLTLDEAVTKLHFLANRRREAEVAARRDEGIDAPARDTITREDVKFLYEATVELFITETINRGFVRFPNGWGGLYLKILNPNGTPRKLPDGRTIAVGPRPAIRYREGLAVRTALNKLSDFEQRTLSRRTPRKSKLDPVE